VSKLPKWFKGELYEEGATVQNRFSGEEYELNALELSMYDFTNYQIKCDRELTKLENQIEIKETSRNRQIDKLKKDLPNDIRKIIGHIEFARPIDKK
jgi:hypothetical protein